MKMAGVVPEGVILEHVVDENGGGSTGRGDTRTCSKYLKKN